MANRSALIIVDVQNDFTPGGSLAVPEGDQVVPVLNEYIRKFKTLGLPIYATRDWHPAVTKHFQGYGGIWPPHCIQGTRGAEFHPDLLLSSDVIIVSKGMDPNEDAYSGFQAVDPNGVDLATSLRRNSVEHLFIGGLATDYCVRSTLLDALRTGFSATLLVDASLGVNLQPHDAERAIKEMVAAGANVTTVNRIRV